MTRDEAVKALAEVNHQYEGSRDEVLAGLMLDAIGFQGDDGCTCICHTGACHECKYDHAFGTVRTAEPREEPAEAYQGEPGVWFDALRPREGARPTPFHRRAL